jgi:hypothetical protein
MKAIGGRAWDFTAALTTDTDIRDAGMKAGAGIAIAFITTEA